MSPFDPFRGGDRPKGTMSPFFPVFFKGELPLVESAQFSDKDLAVRLCFLSSDFEVVFQMF